MLLKKVVDLPRIRFNDKNGYPIKEIILESDVIYEPSPNIVYRFGLDGGPHTNQLFINEYSIVIWRDYYFKSRLQGFAGKYLRKVYYLNDKIVDSR